MIHTPKGKTKQPAFAKDKTQGNFQGKKKRTSVCDAAIGVLHLFLLSPCGSY